jgi:KDO2-lipid IV(A) lauroyltransferase
MFLREVGWAAQSLFARLFIWLIRPLPRDVRVRFGEGVGSLIYAVDSRHRRVAMENLRSAYPRADSSWHRDVARRAFRHIGRLLVEILTLPQRLEDPLDDLRIEGWHHLQTVQQGGRGYFLVSAHFGNWERIALFQAMMGYPLTMIVRPLDNPYLERLLAEIRECCGNRVAHKRNAVREIVKALRTGGGVAFMIDQNFGESGRVFPPFFDRPAATTPVLGRIAAKMNVPVLPVFAFPLLGGRYRIVYGPPIKAARSGDIEKDAMAITEEVTRRVEGAIRSSPGAWFWMHRRWRTRPDAEAGGPHAEASPVSGGDEAETA